MNRDAAIRALQTAEFDMLVIGGGATGLGCALDAAARGYRTALIEAHDFAKATSSRSTKLVHGGVRYLQQGNIALVREALHEREYMRANAPDLVRELEFFVPAPSQARRLYYAVGLRLYDALAGKSSFARSRTVRGGVVYTDAQFDDARYAVALARTASDRGAAVANYVRAIALQKQSGRICGVRARDEETGREIEICAHAAINAGGIFADEIRRMDDAHCAALLAFSRGTHIVAPAGVLEDDRALLVPRTSDGRVLFAIPWLGATLIGTTDVAAPRAEIEPHPSDDEIEYILATVNRYVPRAVRREDVQSAFAGLRPLVRRAKTATAKLSREHLIAVSESGMVTVTGGKWTTYRKMAEDAVDAAERQSGFAHRPCKTRSLVLIDDTRRAQSLANDDRIAHYVEREMARTVEDVLARRSRTLFVNANAAAEAAPETAAALARHLGRPAEWAEGQVRGFLETSRRYAASAPANSAV